MILFNYLLLVGMYLILIICFWGILLTGGTILWKLCHFLLVLKYGIRKGLRLPGINLGYLEGIISPGELRKFMGSMRSVIRSMATKMCGPCLLICLIIFR